MRIRLVSGPYNGMLASGPDGSNVPDFLGFDQRGHEDFLLGDASKPMNLLAWHVEHPPGLGESDSDAPPTLYKRTDRKDDEGLEIWEYVPNPDDQDDDSSYEEPLID